MKKKSEERNQTVRLLDDIGRILPELKPEIEKIGPPANGPYGPGELHLWFVLITWTVLRIVLHIGRRLLQEVVDEHVHGLDRPMTRLPENGRICPCANCGSLMWHYNGATPFSKTFCSLFGPVVLHRYQAECSRCAATFFPLDHILALSSTFKVFPALQQLTVLLGTWLPFRRASEVLKLALGIRMSAETVRKITEAVGEAVGVRQENGDWDPELEILRNGMKQAQGALTLESGLDGMMVPLNEKPKAEPGSHKEARSLVLRLKDGTGKILAKLTVSRLTDLPTFLRSIGMLFDECRETLDIQKIVLAGDGARWIWEFGKSNFICQTVLDWYHLACYYKTLLARMGPDAGPCRWKRLHRIKEALWNGRVDEALTELAGLRCRNDEQRKAKEDLRRYVANNRDHIINYRWNRSRRKLVGSGFIEGGHKSSIHDRLKCTGMRWSEPGSDHTMAARCSQLNGTAEYDIRNVNLAA